MGINGFHPHPLAAAWPRRSFEQREALRASMASVGQKQPIIHLGHAVIDGNERLSLCEELKLKPRFALYDGDKSEAGILQAIIAFNGGRHLDKSQRGMLAAEALPRFEKLAADNKREAGRAAALKQHGRVPAQAPEPTGDARDQVAKLFAVGSKIVSECKLILASDRTLAKKVKNGEITVARAKRKLHREQKRRLWVKLTESIKLTDDTCKILVGDCRKKLNSLATESVDLVFTDPPYGIGDDYNKFDDNLSRDQLMQLLGGCADELPRVLTPTASVFMMMSSRYAEDVGALLRHIGLHRLDTIIWPESFSSHNGKFWTDSYRVIHHYAVDPKRFTFNYADTRAYIPSWRNENEKIGRQDEDGKLPGNVWGVWTDREIPRVVDNHPERIPDKIAPNQLPVKLVERAVLLASNPDQTVLDPFHGTGTTAVASLLHGRRYVGIEMDEEIARRSRGWIKARLAQRRKSNET